MTQKTISLPENVYQKLRARKKDEETFTDLILRLLQESESREDTTNIESFFGSFDDDDDEWEEIEKHLYDNREQPRNRNITTE